MRVTVVERAANYLVLVVFAVLVLAPISVILGLAFGPRTPAEARAGGLFHPENFAEAWVVGRFGQYLITSAVVAVIVVAMSVTASVLAGYALGAMRFRGQGAVFGLFLLGIMVPTEAFVVPLFFDLRQLGLTNTLWGVALPQVAMSIAFGTYWMRTYFRSAPASLIEAARLDGAGSMRILWWILVPTGRPAILTLVLLVFMWTWNEFLIPLVMSPNASIRTAPLGLAFFQGQYTQGAALLAAGAVLVATPVVLAYVFLQRHFIRGMLEGAARE